MGTFKTLEAYFRPVQRPPSSNAPASNSTDPAAAAPAEAAAPAPRASGEPLQAEARGAGATPQQPPAAPPAAPGAPSARPASKPTSSQAATKAAKNFAAAPKPPQPPAASAAATAAAAAAAVVPTIRSKDCLLAEMLHGRRALASTSGPPIGSGGGSGGNASDGAASAAGASARHDATAGAATVGCRRQQGTQQGAAVAGTAATAAAAAAAVAGAAPASANAAARAPVHSAAPIAASSSGSPDPQTGPVIPPESMQRPRKRPCLQMTMTEAAAAVAAAAEPPQPRAARAAACAATPLERRPNLVCLLQARSVGRFRSSSRREELWWKARRPRLVQAGCWSAAEGLRAASVVHQDAVTQIELSSETDGRACLAVAQANQLVRIVPYSVLRDYAEAWRATDQQAMAADGDAANSSGDGSDDGDDVDVDRGQRRRRRRQPTVKLLPWQDLVDAGRVRHSATWEYGTARSSSVLTINTRSHVACLGWDPRRRGRLALADRCSQAITVLDLGWEGSNGAGAAAGGGGGGSRTGSGFTRSHLNVGSAGPGGAAARAVTYLKYGGLGAPYTLAAAGRAGGEGAVVHLWDERRGGLPVSRLACPGGASLVARMEPSLDGTALLGVVDPGTLVLWDVRRASNAAAASAVFSLGSAAPAPSAVVGSWDLLSPLAAAGCVQKPLISSLAPDPRDASRTALLMQDGSSAIWSFASAAVTHASSAPRPHHPFLTGPGPVPVAAAAAAAGGPASAETAATSLHTLRRSLGGNLEAAVDGCGLLAVGALSGFGLYGMWDADVCGFWHPMGRLRPDGGDGGADRMCPVLAMTDCRTSRSAAAAAAVQLPPQATVAPSSRAPGVAAVAEPPPPPPAVLQPLDDWPLCVACLPETGDLVAGSLRGQLMYFLKS
ncbi:hypothetical protein PLESTB_000658800 [Pleodorina starrii]|uniref:Uncharacterized protein n=1 Tax=Pleodorina starrii TaxID=330485 RepID=A0A9W6BJS2_9CHLO|nr:hypothetical protein PLESTM_001321700 [Pleodorina starrii]GLC52701.1 hypothetical protein PLESTB_000658800 [Pleodorina starrii]